MKNWSWIGLVALVLVGCDAQAQNEVSQHGGAAMKSASKAATVAFDSLMKKVNTLSKDASPEVQKQMRDAVEGMQKQLNKVPNLTPEIQQQKEALNQAVTQLDAQQRFQDLRQQYDAKLKELQGAGKTLEDAQKQLQDLNQQKTDAEKTLDDARQRLGTMMM
jgi:DNA repair exonuclease SbcCD ATPase subunit